MDRTLPLNLLLKGRTCLVAGGGAVACRKVRTLLDRGAHVIVVAPEIHGSLRTIAAADRLELREARYRDEDLLVETKPFLVYAATDDDALNRRIVADAKGAGCLVTSASSWEEGDFLSPAIIPWGDGQISVTTDGASCLRSQFMRKRLEHLFGSERTWLCVAARDAGTDDVPPLSAEGLDQLAALEEFVLLPVANGAVLYAWAADDDGLLATIVHVLQWGTLYEHLDVERGDAVVLHAVQQGGDALLDAILSAKAANTAGPRLSELAVLIQEARGDV